MQDTGSPTSRIPHPPSTKQADITAKGFHVPYINSRYGLPLVWAGIAILLYFWKPPELTALSRLITLDFDRDDWPLFIFIIAALVLTVMSIMKKLSLIPVLGLLSSLFLMVHLGFTNWMRFLVWLAIGMIIYVMYSRKHSRLRHPDAGCRMQDTGSKDPSL